MGSTSWDRNLHNWVDSFTFPKAYGIAYDCCVNGVYGKPNWLKNIHDLISEIGLN